MPQSQEPFLPRTQKLDPNAPKHLGAPWWREGLKISWTNPDNNSRNVGFHAEVYELNSKEVTDANADLIVAAPELLKALKDLVALTKFDPANFGPSTHRALAAIAKAEGRV